MTKQKNLEATSETSRLLSELDLALNQSCVMRDIISKYEHMRSIESLTGPSRVTRIMRKEIQIMESKLQLVRGSQATRPESFYSPA